MARIALVSDIDEIIRIVPEETIDQTAGVKAGYRWLPVVYIEVDNSTLDAEYTVVDRTGPTVEATQVSFTLTTRDMTQQELDTKNDGEIDSIQTSSITRALAKALFQTLNYARAANGDPELTAAQFRTFLRNQL